MLERLKLTAADARRPEVVASELVTRVHPNQAQLINRMGGANLLLQDETMFLIEATPGGLHRDGGQRRPRSERR